MANLFQTVSNAVRGSRFVVIIMISAIAMVFIGAVHFIEDVYSSFEGILKLQEIFSLEPVRFEITYWTMSFANQVGQIIFGWMYANDTKGKRWAAGVAFAFFTIDFIADLQWRSRGQLFPVDGTTMLDHPSAVIIAALGTLGYFTIGSEMFLTMGTGLILELFSDSVKQLASIYVELKKALIKAKIDIADAREAIQTSVNRIDRRGR